MIGTKAVLSAYCGACGLSTLQMYAMRICETITMNRDPRTYAIIGAAIEVHRELGHGFLEAVYQEALALEFERCEIPFQREVELPISYKGKQLLCSYRADFVCFKEVIVELKALRQLSGCLGLSLSEHQLISFQVPSCELAPSAPRVPHAARMICHLGCLRLFLPWVPFTSRILPASLAAGGAFVLGYRSTSVKRSASRLASALA